MDPDVVARISNLELRARQIVEGFISGRHRSPFHGQSVEFAEHREYVPGDDVRRLDWKVWAKGDRLYVKEYEEETNLRATLVQDVSKSMQYGEGRANKHEFACQLGAAVAYLLLRQSDSVGFIAFDDQVRVEVSRRSAQSHLRTILQAMLTAAPENKTNLEPVFRQIAERESSRGLMIVVSDLLADRESVFRGLTLLRKRRHDVILLHVMHDDEVSFPFQGATRFEGLEAQRRLTCDPRALREGYVEAVRRYLAALRRFCSRAGVDYRFVRTSEGVDAVLASLLHERARA